MDSKYIKRLFGNNYHGFNYKEAERNVGVSYLEFLTRIQEVGGKPKLSEKIRVIRQMHRFYRIEKGF